MSSPCPSPPPPYSLQPPPYTRRRRKQPPREPSPPPSPRLSSREMLTEALKCARGAVKHDSVEADMPAAVAAYDEAIVILQRVIARRSQRPGIKNEVERVTSIHDKYADRVRELCRKHGIPLPSHVTPDRGGFTPSMKTCSLPLLDPPRSSSPDTPRRALETSSSLEQQSSLGDDETEWGSEPALSSSSSRPETPLPTSPAGDYVLEGREWVLSAACEEDVNDWGQYLGEAAANRQLSADATAVWGPLARPHEDLLQHFSCSIW